MRVTCISRIGVGQTRGTLTNVQGYSTRKAYVKNLCIPFPVPLPHLLERGEALLILGLIERVHRLLTDLLDGPADGGGSADRGRPPRGLEREDIDGPLLSGGRGSWRAAMVDGSVDLIN